MMLPRAFTFITMLLLTAALAACDSNDPAEEEPVGGALPENYQDGWVLQLVGARGASVAYTYTNGTRQGSGSASVPDLEASDPFHISTFGTGTGSDLQVDVTYTSGGDGEIEVRLYYDAELQDDATLDEGDSATLSGSE